ncbi:MAG: aminoacyl-tRNA hydrolase [Clostridiales bacterium]|jgi:PTH1 family peptidyl-tRNA hydrolase|nr:aminoacyl-tRNA hydrolase [Clostridiales bacterium]
MLAIAGLGNPGAAYANTRHNVGFQVIDRLSSMLAIPLNRSKCRAILGEGTAAGQRIVLLKPQTYMNLSGESIQAALQWYKLTPEEMLIISDDIDLPAGSIRIRPHGGAGTHNGWKSILQQTGSDRFPRIRLGVGTPPPQWDLKDWVLSGFGDQQTLMQQTYQTAAKAAECFLRHGIDLTMNRYNTRKNHDQNTV